jgi:hypothetical protein
MVGYNNAAILGGAGAVIGSSVTRNNPAAGAVVGGVGGYYVGRMMDQREAAARGQYNEMRAAEGRTNCTATYSGTIDPAGNPTARTSPYNCTFSNSAPGNHNMPPRATPQ